MKPLFHGALPVFPALLLLGGCAMTITQPERVAPAPGEFHDEPAPFAQVNERWRGASCTWRYNWKFSADGYEQGWGHTGWTRFAPAGAPGFYSRLWVSDRKAVARLLRNGRLPAGTRFTCLGWGYTNPSERRGVALFMKFRDVDAYGAHVFWPLDNLYGINLPVSLLDEAERYTRLYVVQVTPPDERMIVGKRLDKPKPAIRVERVSVQPASSRPGRRVTVEAAYRISGVSEPVEIMEHRIVHYRGWELARFRMKATRRPGSYVSRQRIQIPARAEPGEYEVRLVVEAADGVPGLSPADAMTSFILASD